MPMPLRIALVALAAVCVACNQQVTATPKDTSRETETPTFNHIVATPPEKTVYFEGETGPLLSEIKAGILNVEIWYSDNTHTRTQSFTLEAESGAIDADTGRLDTSVPGEKVFTVTVAEGAETRQDTFALLVPAGYDGGPVLSLSIARLPSNAGADGDTSAYFNFDAPILSLLDDSEAASAFWAELVVIGHAAAGKKGLPCTLPPERYKKTLLLSSRSEPEADMRFGDIGFGPGRPLLLKVEYQNEAGTAALADTRALPVCINNVKFDYNGGIGDASYDYVPPERKALFYGLQGRSAGMVSAGQSDTLWAPENAAASIINTEKYTINIESCRLSANGTVFVPVRVAADAVWGNSERVYDAAVRVIQNAEQLALINPAEKAVYILSEDLSPEDYDEWALAGNKAQSAGWFYSVGRTIKP